MTTLQDKVKLAIKSAPMIDGDPLAVWLDEAPKIDMETNNREEADIMIDDVCERIAQAAIDTVREALLSDENFKAFVEGVGIGVMKAGDVHGKDFNEIVFKTAIKAAFYAVDGKI